MAPLSSPRKNTPKRLRLRKSLRSLIEFGGGDQIDQSQFQSTTRKLYDGPAGAVLYLASKLSLHDPLVGRIIRTRRFDVTEFRSILDIGSGAGQILGHLLRETHPDARLVACDLSHQMLKRARVRMDSPRPNYLSADMTNLPFQDESFDCVTCGWVLEYVADPRHGLTEIHRVLRRVAVCFYWRRRTNSPACSTVAPGNVAPTTGSSSNRLLKNRDCPGKSSTGSLRSISF